MAIPTQEHYLWNHSAREHYMALGDSGTITGTNIYV